VDGIVHTTTVIAGDEPPQVRVGRMHFAPGARTAWHSHAGGEYLHIEEGTALMQERGGDIKRLYAGDTIYTEADVEHWHGATKQTFMSLLAIWGAPPDTGGEPETSWGAHVKESELPG
jgi:quercetin dioxygenase-like cupin family protein